MNNRNRQVSNPFDGGLRSTPTIGVLQSIADGLSLVLARPYLLLLPLLVDLVIWLSAQISVLPLTDALQTMMRDYGGANGPEAADELARIGDVATLNDLAGFFIPSIFAGLPKETPINWFVSFLAPAVSAGIDRDNIFHGYGNGPFAMWMPPHSAAVVTMAAGIFIGATALLAIFRVPIAHTIRGSRASLGETFREIVRSWINIVGLVMLGIGAVLILLIPLTMLFVLTLIFGASLAVFLVFIAVAVLGMVAVSLLFVVDAMILLRTGPIDAIRASYLVTRGRFGECFRFAMTTVLIQTGLLHVWNTVIDTPPGIAIALIGNAFFGASIAAASMIFFSDRFREWKRSTRSGSARPTINVTRR